MDNATKAFFRTMATFLVVVFSATLLGLIGYSVSGKFDLEYCKELVHIGLLLSILESIKRGK